VEEAVEISVSEAADAIGVDRSRLLHWLRDGELAGRRVGGIWLVDAADAALHAGRSRAPGRPMAPARAWGLLDILDGGDAPWLTSVARSQVRALLRELVDGLAPGPDRWRALLRARNQNVKARAHPAALARLLHERDRVLRAGPRAAAAAGIDLVALDPVEHLYVPADRWPELARRLHIEAAVPDPNLVVHLPAGPWPFDRRGTVSDAAIAADLLESAEPRAVSGGVARLNTLARAARAGRPDGVARTGRVSA
jgi:excisionase family DNA binding protein